MSGFNPQAESHLCMGCEHGGTWTEMGKEAGNYCLHPITREEHPMGRYHTQKTVPMWCPEKEKSPGKQD